MQDSVVLGMNYVEQWLAIIGTPQRAQTLLERRVSEVCPSETLFGAEGSDTLYALGFHKALDAWDTGRVSQREISAWARHVQSGEYRGPAVWLKVEGVVGAGRALLVWPMSIVELKQRVAGQRRGKMSSSSGLPCS